MRFFQIHGRSNQKGSFCNVEGLLVLLLNVQFDDLNSLPHNCFLNFCVQDNSLYIYNVQL